jgi:hypothetical protein
VGAAARFPILESLYFARTGAIFLSPVRTFFSLPDLGPLKLGVSVSGLTGNQPTAITWNTHPP